MLFNQRKLKHLESKDLLQAVQMCDFKRNRVLKNQFEIRAQGVFGDLFSDFEEKPRRKYLGGGLLTLHTFYNTSLKEI